MKTLLAIIILTLSLFRSLLAEERPEAVILQRLIENKWFDCAETKNAKLVTLSYGDPLYNGIRDILKKALDGKQLESTVFTAGLNKGPTVRVDPGKNGNGLVF